MAIEEHEEEMEEYQRKIDCCINGDCKGPPIDCDAFLYNNQCLMLVSGTEFSEIRKHELYSFDQGGQRYCFTLSELQDLHTKSGGLNPFTKQRLPISRKETNNLLTEFNQWVKRKEEVVNSISALYAHLNNMVQPHILPSLESLNRNKISNAFSVLVQYPVIAPYLEEGDHDIFTLINPIEKFLRVCIRLLNISDEHQEYRKTLISHSLAI